MKIFIFIHQYLYRCESMYEVLTFSYFSIWSFPQSFCCCCCWFFLISRFSMNTKCEYVFITIKFHSAHSSSSHIIPVTCNCNRIIPLHTHTHTIIIKFCIFATSHSLWLCLSAILRARVFVTCIQTPTK